MQSFIRCVYTLIIISTACITSAHTSGFNGYLNQLRDFKKISQDIHKEKKISTPLKDKHDQLARDVNKFIDYLLATIDNPTNYQPDYMSKTIDQINDQARALQEKFRQEKDKRSKMQAVILLSMPSIQAVYDLLKEIADDLQKNKIKADLMGCKWNELKLLTL